ncbi:MAG: AP endonuclease [Saprospiraceae bacterium]|nr:AP endonuclease [Saprospiraceae bacterium]
MKYLLITLPFLLVFSCQTPPSKDNLNIDNIYAWCIVPFDSLERTPEQRIEMLKRLNIKRYAYDWRVKHLESMGRELELAKDNDIEVISVWMWIDAQRDTVGKLNEPNEELFKIVEQMGYKGQLWVSFHANFFAGLSDPDAVQKGAEMIAFLSKRAQALGCNVGLYNHGDWFGEPGNQIKIIEALPEEDLGLIYNFHHGHHQIDAFPQLVEEMLPYLWYVNLNGLQKGGPKILTIGKGDHEKEMIELLLAKGYDGDFGILGHVEEADVEVVLQANLDGLKELMQE